jgi:peptide/nickel transport system substrate-binding protein
MTKKGKVFIALALALMVLPLLNGFAGGQEEAAVKSKAVIAQGVDTEAVDPTFAQSTASWNVLHHIFEPLLLRDADMVLQPVLAESWEVVNELTWQFKLRRGVTFHSGAPFNAEAVKFTLERMFNPDVKTKHRAVRDIPLDKVEVVDEVTVNIVTKKPTPLMPHFLRTVLIIDPGMYAGKIEPLYDQASGTGPYQLIEWVRDDHLSLAANSAYWGGAPAIQELVFRPIPEASTRIAELLTGAVDLIVNVPPDQSARLETENSGIRASSGGRDVFLGLIADKPPFDDLRVRQAVNYAVDVDAINKALLGGLAEPYASVCMPPNDNPKIKPYSFDQAKARRLLAEAGYADGLAITLQTPNGRYLKDKEAAQAVAGYLDQVGIKVRVEALDWSVFVPNWLDRKTSEMFLLGLGGWFDGQGELSWLTDEVSRTGWVNDKFMNPFQELAVTFDESRRLELIMEAQAVAAEDVPWLFLWRQPSIYGVNKNLNWEPRRDEYIFLWDASFK